MRRSLAGRLLSQAARAAWGAAGGAGAATCAVPAGPPAAARQLWGQWQQPAAHLQRAGIRTRHAKHPHHPKPPRSRLRRALAAAGTATGLAAVGLPAAAVVALVVKSRDEADAWEVLGSLPRTARIVWWGAWATLKAGWA